MSVSSTPGTCSPREARKGVVSLPMTVTLAALVTRLAATSIPGANIIRRMVDRMIGDVYDRVEVYL